MKKILLFVAAAFIMQTANAQLSLTLSNPPTTVTGGYSQGILSATFDVINTGGQALDISVARTVISEVPGSINNICWGINCYPPNVSITPSPQTIPAGGIDNSFIADYDPQSNAGITTVRYCFYVAGTVGDSLCTTINFDASNAVAGLDDLAKANKPGIELTSGNPASALAMFRYFVPANSQQAKLVVHNMAGSLIQESNLRSGNGNIVFATNNLPAGVYVYSMITDGAVVSTQKLVVKH